MATLMSVNSVPSWDFVDKVMSIWVSGLEFVQLNNRHCGIP